MAPEGQHRWNVLPFHIGGGDGFWSSVCLSLSPRALSAARWLFCVSPQASQAGLLAPASEHPSSKVPLGAACRALSDLDHPAFCLPQLPPADPLDCWDSDGRDSYEIQR